MSEQTENTQPDNVAPPEPSPAAMERVAAIRAMPEFFQKGPQQRALMQELRGLLTTTGAPEEPEEHAATVPLDEQRRRDLARDPEYLAGNREKVAEMRRLVARLEQADPVDAQRREQMTLAQRREEYGLRTDDLLKTPWAKEAWSPGDESTFLDLAHEQGFESALVRDLVGDYARAVQGTMGEVTDEMIEEFHAKYDQRLTRDQRDLLVQWIRESAS